MTTHHHRVAVRSLVEFIERRGDLNFRFSSRSTALEGIRGHQRVQRGRGEGYVAEKEVSAEETLGELHLSLSGRVDGYFPDRDPIEVDEIKTIRMPVEQVPDDVRHLHRGQARIYAYLLAIEHGRDSALVRLCYFNVDDDTEYQLTETLSLDELAAYYQDVLRRYAAWYAGLARWRGARDAAIAQLDFPYGGYRAGQRDMAVNVYRALKEQRHMVIQAPTGIGKTMATLFPAVKALKELAYDKVFFLTAKTSGQEMAERSIADLKSTGLKLRDITLTAKEKVCFNPGSPCDPEHCEYAAGYYNRLPAVIDSAMQSEQSLDRRTLEALAREHTICPFELSLDLSRVADVVICDYNYVFDPTVYLRRYFDDATGRYAFLVDESHNLVERGREMFSATIVKEDFMSLRRSVLEALPHLARRLAAVNREFLALRRDDKPRFERDGHLALDGVPDKLVAALRGFCEVAEDWLKENRPAPFQPEMLERYFDSLRFIRVSEWFDDHYACFLERTAGETRLRLYNLNPAVGLGQGLRRGAAVLCFSATMTPQAYFQGLMGLAEDSAWYKIPSPFPPEHLGVFSAPFISTAWRDRDASLGELVRLVAGVTQRRRGNYLVFLPSYTYLGRTWERFVAEYPQVRTLRQEPGMSEEARAAFLANFTESRDAETLVGFAVMGGVFGEGVDLAGTRLIGVIIAGVGLPGVGVERNRIRDYFDKDQRGFEFAYQYPGINRVLQTAGRVIRGAGDRGIVCLVDRRFAESRYRNLLPAEWQVRESGSHEALTDAIGEFWRSVHPADAD